MPSVLQQQKQRWAIREGDDTSDGVRGSIAGGQEDRQQFKTKRARGENVGDENGRREGERETFTKTPGTGLVKETIPREQRKWT